MSLSKSINRIRIDPDALDFETLRKDSIALVQNLCGDLWTDYNLHDPGVTILEQLSYALTDLSYRTGFPVQDYLAGSDGVIDYEKLTLYPPHEILPSPAVTKTDYEKILYDAVPEIDHVRLESSTSDETTGLYTVYVKIDQDWLQTPAGVVMDPEKHEIILNRINPFLDGFRRLHKVIGHIKENLQTRQNTLKRWRDRFFRDERMLHDVQIALIERLITRSSEVLSQLEKQLSSLSCVQDELTANISTLANEIRDSKRMNQLEALLAKLDLLFKAPQLSMELDHMFSLLDRPIKKLTDLLPVLDNILPRLILSLRQTDHHLKDFMDDMKSVKTQLLTFHESEIKKKILAAFSANRSLCEDIHNIHVIKTLPVFLTGEIEIHLLHNPAKVYADIYFRCSRYISSNIRMNHYGAVLAGNKNYEEAFSGPLTLHGHIRDESLALTRRSITLMDLMTCIRNIKGVVQIRNLNVMDKNGQQHFSLDYRLSQHQFPGLHLSQVESAAHILHLSLPQDFDEGEVSGNIPFRKNETASNTVFFEEFNRELNKLIFEYHAFRRNTQSFTQFITLPGGQARRLNHYHSVQNHFPAIYGINQYGIPKSRPAETHAKAKQLKAYLYPFEQLMANYLQNLQKIPDLFSVDRESKETCFSQFLDDGHVPEIETLYAENNIAIPSAIDDILGQYDNYGERKNRILDILLALYGEAFDQRKLLRFNYYRQDDADDWIIENKINYLKAIREISRDRGKGFDYLQPDHNSSQTHQSENVTGLHAKICFLLGLVPVRTAGFVTETLVKKNSRLVSDEILARRIKFLSDEGQGDAVPVLPGFNHSLASRITLPSRLPTFSYSIFKKGITLDHYRLVRSGRQETTICFRNEQDNRLWVLAKEATYYKATVYAHQFCRTLLLLNTACENFHMIEHILLRPRGQESWRQSTSDAEFFSCRISILFPSWTARFDDKGFRKFAEEIIRKNLPAHVFADFFWLDFTGMQDFEQRYRDWLNAMQLLSQAHEVYFLAQLDKASEKIISFLKEYKQESDCDYWL